LGLALNPNPSPNPSPSPSPNPNPNPSPNPNPDQFEGTLKYNAVVKALKAGKAAQMVKAWMRREGVTVAPDTPFDDLETVMESEVRPHDACTPTLLTAYLLTGYLLPPTYRLPTAYLLTTYSGRGGCRWSNPNPNPSPSPDPTLTGCGAAAGGLRRGQAARPRHAHRRAQGAQAVRERRGHGAEARTMRAARGAIGLGRFAWPRTAVPHARAVSAQTLAQGAIGECKACARGYEVPRYDAPLVCFFWFTQ